MASIQATNDGYENHFLMEIISELYLKTETADVYFVFGDDDNRVRIPAHKSLLAAGSDVFKAMFYGDLKEKSDVEITDASADAFKEFLQFFYQSKVNLSIENAFDVVNLGKKYDVRACQKICDRFLKDELTHSNDSVCSVYSLATYFDLDDIRKLCESKIVEYTDAVFDSSSFLDCDQSVLSHILKCDELSSSEVNVFHACMNWVKAKSKQEELTKEIVQAHLGDLFYEIRFRSVTLEDIVDLTPSYGKVFCLDEYQEILQIIRWNDFQPKMFKKDRRETPVPKWNANAVIACNRRREGGYVDLLPFKTVEKTTFRANKRILLGEIQCLRVRGNPVSGEMTISEISDDGVTKILCSNKSILFSYPNSVDVALNKPILIKPGFKYNIEFKHSSAHQMRYEGFLLMDKLQIPKTDVIIDFIDENKTGGIVHDLRINLISNGNA